MCLDVVISMSPLHHSMGQDISTGPRSDPVREVKDSLAQHKHAELKPLLTGRSMIPDVVTRDTTVVRHRTDHADSVYQSPLLNRLHACLLNHPRLCFQETAQSSKRKKLRFSFETIHPYRPFLPAANFHPTRQYAPRSSFSAAFTVCGSSLPSVPPRSVSFPPSLKCQNLNRDMWNKT